MAHTMTDFAVSPLTPERWPALEDLFGRAGASVMRRNLGRPA